MSKASERVKQWRKENPEKRKAQSKREFESLKADPIRYREHLDKKKKWDKAYAERRKAKGNPLKSPAWSKLTEVTRQKKLITDRAWRKRNKEKVKILHKKIINRNHFGGNREKAIQRDNETCQKCGITRVEHYKKYNRDITVDHIDRMGRGVSIKEKNNALNNLMTLCISCHMKKDGRENAGHL